MPRKPETRGTCAYCGEILTIRAVDKHLAICKKRQSALQSSNQEPETLWRLHVQPARSKRFWLELEMRGSADLEHLDQYLRAIWLECCGHLSEYSLDSQEHMKVAKFRTADDVFAPGLVLHHLYDFGTSSHTNIQVLGASQGKPVNQHPISLLARNQMPEETCAECEQKAAWMCMECLIEFSEMTFLCDRHRKKHVHTEGPLTLVNSPRLGMCGYSGPATPPY